MKDLIAKVIVHVMLVLVTCVTLTPMVWLVAATFKHPDYIFSYTFFGPVYDEPAEESVFAWHFWNEFENATADTTPDEAFKQGFQAAYQTAYGEAPSADAADRFLEQHPDVFTEDFATEFERDDALLFTAFYSEVAPADASEDFVRIFIKNFDSRYDPNYTGVSMEEPRAFLPTLSTFNFKALFDSIPFARYVINSFFVTTATVIIQLFFSSLGGFALAKYEFRGKRIIMMIMLLTMMIPGQVLLAPLYELIYRIGLVDSYFGLIIPGAVNIFGMFLFRQSMMHIPTDLLEAGRVDGCSEFRVYWSIVLPVSRPMIGAFSLIAFMMAWNNFLWPQIILHTQERFTLTIGLSQMVGVYESSYGALMAGTFLSVIPVIALFFLLQKEFISGLTAGAVKT